MYCTVHTADTAHEAHRTHCRYWSGMGVATRWEKALQAWTITGDSGLSDIQHVMEIITHEKVHNVPGEQHPSIEEIHHPGDVILPLPRWARRVAQSVSFSGRQTLQRVRLQVWHLDPVFMSLFCLLPLPHSFKSLLLLLISCLLPFSCSFYSCRYPPSTPAGCTIREAGGPAERPHLLPAGRRQW